MRDVCDEFGAEMLAAHPRLDRQRHAVADGVEVFAVLAEWAVELRGVDNAALVARGELMPRGQQLFRAYRRVYQRRGQQRVCDEPHYAAVHGDKLQKQNHCHCDAAFRHKRHPADKLCDRVADAAD